MRKLFYLLALLLLLPTLTNAQMHPALVGVEADSGTPTGYFYKIKFTTGTVTDNGDGTASINIGSSTGDVESVGSCSSGACPGTTMTWGAGTTIAWTFNASAGTDPVLTFTNGVMNLSAGALQVGGVPIVPGNIPVLTSTATGDLSAEVNLGALTTGLLKITVSAGTATPSTAAAGTDYVAPDGNAATATALAANGADCNAGYAPRGVDASGAAENCTQYQAYDADLTTYAGITPSANVQSLLGAADYAAFKALISVDDLVTLSGVADGAVNLGAFTGTTIGATSTIKEALQTLVTAFEALPGGHTQNTDTGTTSATFTIESGGVKIKNSSGTLQVRNNADAAFAPLQATTITGTVITASTNFAGNITGNVTGNADTATSATTASTVVVIDTTDTSAFIAMFDSATGTMAIKTDAGLTYNAGTGVLTATGFSGPLTGNVTGNASGTAATVTGAAQTAITSVGTLTALTVSGAIVPNAVGTIDLGSTSAELRNIFLGNSGVLYGQIDQSATLTSSASTWTASALTSTGTFTANGNVVIGNADTDTFTIQSMIIGGNSRAVQIAASVASPTYATGTNELYVAGDIETAANVYAAAFIGGTGTDGQRRISFTNNTTFDCAAYPNSIYFVGDALLFCNSTASKTPARLEDAQTFTGAKTFTGGIYSGDASTAASIRLYDGTSNYFTITTQAMASNYTLTLPADDGTTNQVLTTDGSGTLSWGTPTATAAGATAGMVQYNATGTGGALAGDAGFIFDTTTDKLTLGASGGSTTGTVELYYTGTTYAATITPNASMGADVTITLPASSGTLISSAGSETWTGVQTFSAAANNSSVNVLTSSGTINMNGDDIHRDLFIDHTLTAGTITGTGNVVVLIDIDAMAGDANTSLAAMRIGNLTGTTGAEGEVEYGIMIGTGWDRGLSVYSPTYIGDGTNGMTVSATGAVSFAGTATFSAGSATTSIPMVVGTGTASGVTAAGQMYFESDTEILTIGDGATSISLDFTPNTVITFPSATSTLQTTTGTPAGFVIASQAAGDLLYASSSSAWARLAVAGQPGYTLTSGTTAGGTTPLWQAPGAAGTFYRGAGTTTTPTWSTSTFADTYVQGGILHAATANTIAALAPGAVGSFLMSNGASAALSYLAAGAANYQLVGAGVTTIPVWTASTGTGAPVLGTSPNFTTSISIGADPADAGAIRLSNGDAIVWEDATEASLTHINDVGLQANLLFTSTRGFAAGNADTTGGFIRFLEDTDNGTDYSTITGAANAGTYPSFTFSGSQGSEDLTLAVTAANTWAITSSTGVTDINIYGATTADPINLATTGTIRGAVKVIDMGNTAAAYSILAPDAYGSMFLQTHGDAATDVTLPDFQAAADVDHVKIGATVCILTLTAYATLIHPSADDKIRTSNGTLNAGGAGVTGPATVGSFSCYMLTDVATDVGHWTQLGMNGAWAVH